MSSAQAYLEAVKAELNRRRALECTDSLLEFAKEFWHVIEPGREFEENWHHLVLCQHLEAVSEGAIRNLLINIPPGTSKSTFVSVLWPAWEWATQPHLRYLGASYSEPLALRDAQLCRKIISSPRYRELFPQGATLQRGEDNQRKYATQQSGWRMATSVAGRGTGEHPDRKIVDDPHNVKQSESDAERAEALKWFDGTLSSRGVIHDSATVVVMQRLHQKDLSGHIMSLGTYKEDWVHLLIPMEYEEDIKYPTTPLGYKDPRKKEGDLLWPKMFTAKKVAALKTVLGTYKAAGQLQQRPAPAGGGILLRSKFHMWPANKPLPDFEFIVQSYDTAFTEDTKNDPTACLVLGVFYYGGKRNVMIVDAWRDWMQFSVAKARMMKDWKNEYGGSRDAKTGKKDLMHPPRRPDMLIVEKKGSGISLIQDLRLANLPIYAYDPGNKSKVARAHQAEGIMSTDCVWVIESKKEPGQPVTWVREVIDECEIFPNGEHDDYVDDLTQGLIWLALSDHLEMPAVPTEEPEEVQYGRKRGNPYGQ